MSNEQDLRASAPLVDHDYNAAAAAANNNNYTSAPTLPDVTIAVQSAASHFYDANVITLLSRASFKYLSVTNRGQVNALASNTGMIATHWIVRAAGQHVRLQSKQYLYTL